MYKKKIFDKLASITELPTMLVVAMEINRLTSDPNTTIEQIEALIKNDLTLTAKVLKIANSALFAGSKRIVSLNSAISRLGFAEVSKLSLAITFLNTFKPNYVDYEMFWIHSIATAYITTKLNDFSADKKRSERLFTGAILHDIGILILDQHFSEIYKKVFDIALNKNIELTIVEQKVLGTNHAEVGAYLLEKWKIPSEITEIIKFHHQPQKATMTDHETKLIYLANFISNNRGYNNGTGTFPTHFYDDIWDDLKLSAEDIPQIIEEVNEDIEKAKNLLRIGGRYSY